MFGTIAKKISLKDFYFLMPVVLGTFFLGCHDAGQKTAGIIKRSSADSGRQLMIQYCSSCHLPVAPDVLDKKSWTDHVLPAMAPKLGIKVWSKNQYYPSDGQQKASISFNDWLKLVEYFKKESPDTISSSRASASLKKDSWVFKVKRPAMRTSGKAAILMVAFDTLNNKLYTCDDNNDLYEYDHDLKGTQVYHFASPAVSVSFKKNTVETVRGTFTLIGTMQAIDNPLGQLMQVNLGGKVSQPEMIANALQRPVDAVSADFNKDGLEDWVVCAFGHNSGGLYWLQQTADNKYLKNTIREVPGALKAITSDFNQDGWPDIICLFAHGDEGIWLFTNNQKGGFSAVNLLRLHPAYGSTSIQLADFNKDGEPDILYTCGDNSDYSRILKPYHGVYLFLNQGNNSFRQAFFYPVNGCTKAVAADFNNDGNLDIAAIAFFADLKNNPLEKFICFQQDKDKPLHFIPHALPLESYGRWICMDVNDYDHDGDQDIILGNYSKGFINQEDVKTDWDIHLPFVLLENLGKE